MRSGAPCLRCAAQTHDALPAICPLPCAAFLTGPPPSARPTQVLMALPISFTMMAGPSGLLLYMLLIRPFFRAPLGSDKED